MFRWDDYPFGAGGIPEISVFLTMMPVPYGELELTDRFSSRFWSMYLGLGFKEHLVCTVPHLKLSEFREFCMFYKDRIEIWPRGVDS